MLLAALVMGLSCAPRRVPAGPPTQAEGARQEAQLGRNQLEEGDFLGSLRLARAIRLDPSQAGLRQELSSALQEAPRLTALHPVSGDLAVSGDGRWVAFREPPRLLDLESGRETRLDPGGPVEQLTFAQDGRLITVSRPPRGRFRSQVQVWEPSLGQPVGPPLGHEHAVTFATPRGRGELLTGEKPFGGTFPMVERAENPIAVRLWDLHEGRVEKTLLRGASECEVSQDGTRLSVYRSKECLLEVWDLAGLRPLKQRQIGAADAVLFDPRGRFAIVVHPGVWESIHLPSGRKTLQVPVSVAPSHYDLFSGRWLRRHFPGGETVLWDLRNGKIQKKASQRCLASDPDWEWVLTEDEEGVRVWLPGQKPQPLAGAGRRASVVWNQGGLLGLLQGEKGTSLRFWDTRSWRPWRWRFPAGSPVGASSKRVSAVYRSDRLLVWELPEKAVEARPDPAIAAPELLQADVELRTGFRLAGPDQPQLEPLTPEEAARLRKKVNSSPEVRTLRTGR